MSRKLRLTAAVSRAVIVIRSAVCDKVVDPKHREGRGREVTVSSSVSHTAARWSVTCTKTPAAAVQWRRMFIDVSVREKQTLSGQRTDEQTSKWIMDCLPLRDVFICVSNPYNNVLTSSGKVWNHPTNHCFNPVMHQLPDTHTQI